MVKETWTHVWNFEGMPTGKKGKKCRLLPTSKKDKGQGLVMVVFEGGGPDYLVRRKGLTRI